MKKSEFVKLVKKVGGKDKAAEIMGVTRGAVEGALVYGPSGAEGPNGVRSGQRDANTHTVIGAAKIMELQRAAGALKPVKQPEPGNGAGTPRFLSVEALRGVEQVRFEDSKDGFQRPQSESAVAQIEALIRSGFTKFPPIILGLLPGGKLVEIDGQHRRAAHIRAGIGCNAHVYNVKNMDEARLLYLVWNRKARKPTAEETYRASRNPLSGSMRDLERTYGLRFDALYSMVLGLVSSKSADFVDEHADLCPDMLARAKVILGAWTGDVRWGKKDAPTFNSPRFLRALAHFSRGYSPDTLRQAVEVIRENVGHFHKNGVWTRTLRDHGFRKLSTDLAIYVTPHLLGGLTGKSANRARQR